jgi:hypothetical protein
LLWEVLQSWRSRLAENYKGFFWFLENNALPRFP